MLAPLPRAPVASDGARTSQHASLLLQRSIHQHQPEMKFLMTDNLTWSLPSTHGASVGEQGREGTAEDSTEGERKKERMKESVQGLKKEIVPVAPVPVA